MKLFGRHLLALLWGALSLEFRSPGFLAHAPTCVKRLEVAVRGNAA